MFGFFTKFGGANEFIFRGAEQADARLMLHISTQDGYGTREVVTPRGIAHGDGDRYLVGLNRRIAEYGRADVHPADGRDEPGQQRLLRVRQERPLARAGALDRRLQAGLAALDADPARRAGGGRSTRSCAGSGCRRSRRAPRSCRGRRSRCCGCPRRAARRTSPPTCRAPTGPAASYVDWVGTDFYSRFPNFHWLDDFYRDFAGKPFVFGEWALWGADDPGFVSRLFGWIGSHPRVRMVLYNQGELTDGPFRLKRYPRSRRRAAQGALAPPLRALTPM